MNRIFGIALLFILNSAFAGPNEALQDALRADGADRMSVAGKPWDPQISVRDKLRANFVRSQLALGNIRETKDYFAAAMILQHGESPDDYRLANSFAWLAYESMEDKQSIPAQEYAWLYAMSWDRFMLSLGQKQWYKTQRDRTTRTLLPNDDAAASDFDRERFRGPRY